MSSALDQSKAIVGHCILCATAILTIRENPSLSWISITFEILLAHGLLGISQQYLDSPPLRNLFELTSSIVEILPLAFVNTQFLLPVQPSIGYLHAISVVAPLLSNLIQYDQLDEEKIKNIILFANVGSAIYLAIELRNYWFLALAAVALMNRFTIGKIAEKINSTLNTNLSSSQILSIGLAIFCILLTLCLQAL